jgi:integrase
VARESHYGPVWLLMATTGMRRGEVLGLRWKDVDLDGGVLVVQQAIVAIDGRMTVAAPKRGKRRLIALSVEVVAALREHRRTQDERRAALGTVWAAHDLVFPTQHPGADEHLRPRPGAPQGGGHQHDQRDGPGRRAGIRCGRFADDPL